MPPRISLANLDIDYFLTCLEQAYGNMSLAWAQYKLDKMWGLL